MKSQAPLSSLECWVWRDSLTFSCLVLFLLAIPSFSEGKAQGAASFCNSSIVPKLSPPSWGCHCFCVGFHPYSSAGGGEGEALMGGVLCRNLVVRWLVLTTESGKAGARELLQLEPR